MNGTDLMNLLDQMRNLVEKEADALARADHAMVKGTTEAKLAVLRSLESFGRLTDAKAKLSALEQGAIRTLLAACQSSNLRNGVMANLRLVQTSRALNRGSAMPGYQKNARPTIGAGIIIGSA